MGAAPPPGPAGPRATTARALASQSTAFRRLVVAQVVSPLGDSLATVALVLHLQARGGTGTTIAALFFAEAIPPILSPLTGTIADRTRNTRALLAACLGAQAVLVAILAIWLPSLWPVVAIVLARATFDSVTSAALAASVPRVVDDADLPVANATLGAAREIGYVVGPPVAGVLFAAAGARPALVVDALTFVVAIALLASIPRRAADTAASTGDIEPNPTFRADAVDGIRLLFRTPSLRAVAIGFWVAVFLAAPDDLVLPFLAVDELGAGPVGVGVLMGAASFGLVVALPLVTRASRSFGLAGAIVAGAVVTAAGNGLTGAAPVIGLAVLAQVVRGVGIPIHEAAVRTLVQRSVPPAMLGRAFANLYGGVSVAAALGYLAGGPFLDATSPRVAFLVIGAGGLAGAALTWVLLRRVRPPAARAG
ncbi:MAG TPA: MFS transporter [Acidimicrobiales bacterium]